MKLVLVAAAAALAVGVLVSGCAARPENPPRPLESPTATPTESSSPAEPSGPAAPAGPGSERLGTSQVRTSGLNVRYLDQNGEIRDLDVKDFPR